MSNTAQHRPSCREANGTATDAPVESGFEEAGVGAAAGPHASGQEPPLALPAGAILAPSKAQRRTQALDSHARNTGEMVVNKAKVEDANQAIAQRWLAVGAARPEPLRGCDAAALAWPGAAETADAYPLPLHYPAAGGVHAPHEPAGFSPSPGLDAMSMVADHGPRARRTSLCLGVEIARTPQHAYAVLSLRERERRRSHGGRGGARVQAGWVVCAVMPAWTTHQIAAALRVALDTVLGPAARWPDGASCGHSQHALPE